MLPQIYTPKVFVVALALLLCAALWMAAKASAKASATTMSMKLVRAARNVSGRRIGGVRRKPSTFLTRVPRSSSQTAPRTQQSNAAHDRWEQVFLHTSELAARGDVALSGRALLYTAPYNVGANVTAHRSKGNVAYATLACCSPGVRGAAMPGDLIITISASPSNSSARGVNLEHGRVVQSIMIVEGKLQLWNYYGPAAPPWALGRPDRIYTCTLPASGRHIRERFELQAGLAAPSVVQWRSVGRAAWDVEYKGGLKVRFALRHRARFHQLASSNHRNKLPSEDNRNADFHGCVPYGRTFARFPGDSADAAAVLPDKLGLEEDQLGKRNFTYLPMERGSSMRKFVDNLFKLV